VPDSLTPDDVRRRTLETAQSYLLTLGDLDRWIELWHDDGVLEFPFAPSGRPTTYRGKEAILVYMRGASSRIVTDAVDDLRVHAGDDPQVVVAEIATRGHLAQTGARYDQRYVCIFDMRDGLVWRYREYWNPLVSMEAYGGLAEWLAASAQ
jgi:uncharacterized protein